MKMRETHSLREMLKYREDREKRRDRRASATDLLNPSFSHLPVAAHHFSNDALVEQMLAHRLVASKATVRITLDKRRTIWLSKVRVQWDLDERRTRVLLKGAFNFPFSFLKSFKLSFVLRGYQVDGIRLMVLIVFNDFNRPKWDSA